jgi:hypothetical protein
MKGARLLAQDQCDFAEDWVLTTRSGGLVPLASCTHAGVWEPMRNARPPLGTPRFRADLSTNLISGASWRHVPLPPKAGPSFAVQVGAFPIRRSPS